MNDSASKPPEKNPRPVSARKLPANFEQQDMPLFEHELFKDLPPLEVVELKDVKATSEGLLFDRNRIMIESFARPANFQKWRRRSVVKAYVQSLLLRRSRQVDHPVVWATDDWSLGYFHWLCDVLPRIVIASDELRNSTLLLPHDFQNVEFVHASLETLGVTNIEYIPDGEVVKCSQMFLPRQTAASGDFNEPVIAEVRDHFRRRLKSSAINHDRRVYVSRENAAKRRVVNEQQVQDLLKEYDFELVRAEELTFLEQVELFGSARYLIGAHGAGMTNMLFMPDKSHMLEFRKVGDNVNNCYFNMASALGIAYYYQLCVAPRDEDAHLADLHVDTEVLRKNLELMLQGK